MTKIKAMRKNNGDIFELEIDFNKKKFFVRDNDKREIARWDSLDKNKKYRISIASYFAGDLVHILEK